MQAHQQVVPVLGEPQHGLAAALGRVAYALDLDRVDQPGLGAHALLAEYAEVVGLDLVAVDHLVAHALLAGSHVVLQHQLVGRLVHQAAVEREAHRLAAVVAQHLLLGPVEVQFDLLGLAQAAAIEAVGQRQEGIAFHAQQRQAIETAVTSGMTVITGGPGTGKTTTLNAIIKIMKANGKTVLLSAPTGRAAQRMSELTGDEAKTLHRLLEVSWDKHDNPVFNKNERNQLKCDALIVDEVSMVDAFIMESVMRALSTGCRLILVGDSDQLPSVGPGNVLGDLIESGLIPVVRLNEIFRQAQQSLIVTNAHKIVNGEIPILNSADKDFFFLQRNNKSEVSAVIADLCANRLPKAYGYSPFENIQVLAPSKKGELGTAELNHKLQAALNPKDDDKAEITIGSKTFRTGDKVMQIKNNYDIRWFRENGETGEGIFNGDIGIITKIDRKTKSLVVKFFDKIARYTFEFAGDLDFAYAITVHKSQGNEFDAVIIPMFSGPPQLYYRNLLYTAVTRAKKTLVLVGNPSTVEYMVNNNRRTKRYSGLKEFLLRDDTLY